MADLVGLTGQPDHADDGAIAAQRQIDAGPGLIQAAGHGFVNLDRACLGQGKQGTVVHLPEPRGVAAADNGAVGVHHIDVAVENAHCAVDDGLGKRGVDGNHGGQCRAGTNIIANSRPERGVYSSGRSALRLASYSLAPRSNVSP